MNTTQWYDLGIQGGLPGGYMTWREDASRGDLYIYRKCGNLGASFRLGKLKRFIIRASLLWGTTKDFASGRATRTPTRASFFVSPQKTRTDYEAWVLQVLQHAGTTDLASACAVSRV